MAKKLSAITNTGATWQVVSLGSASNCRYVAANSADTLTNTLFGADPTKGKFNLDYAAWLNTAPSEYSYVEFAPATSTDAQRSGIYFQCTTAQAIRVCGLYLTGTTEEGIGTSFKVMLQRYTGVSSTPWSDSSNWQDMWSSAYTYPQLKGWLHSVYPDQGTSTWYRLVSRYTGGTLRVHCFVPYVAVTGDYAQGSKDDFAYLVRSKQIFRLNLYEQPFGMGAFTKLATAPLYYHEYDSGVYAGGQLWLLTGHDTSSGYTQPVITGPGVYRTEAGALRCEAAAVNADGSLGAFHSVTAPVASYRAGYSTAAYIATDGNTYLYILTDVNIYKGQISGTGISTWSVQSVTTPAIYSHTRAIAYRGYLYLIGAMVDANRIRRIRILSNGDLDAVSGWQAVSWPAGVVSNWTASATGVALSQDGRAIWVAPPSLKDFITVDIAFDNSATASAFSGESFKVPTYYSSDFSFGSEIFVMGDYLYGFQLSGTLQTSTDQSRVVRVKVGDKTSEADAISDTSPHWSLPLKTTDGTNLIPDIQPALVTTLAVPEYTPNSHVIVSPASVALTVNSTQQFTASITELEDQSVTWTASEGSITSEGLYTAPNTLGKKTVTATSVSDTSLTGTAEVVVGGVAVDISPSYVVLYPGSTQQFTATVTGTATQTVTWTCSGGSITSEGLLTASTALGTYTVTATSTAYPEISYSATVVVSFNDSTAPTLSIDSYDATVNTSTYMITGIAQDAVALGSITGQVNGGAPVTLASFAVSPAVTSAQSFSYTPTLTVGTNTITITAIDQAGNKKSSTATIKYDNSAPRLTVTPKVPLPDFTGSLLVFGVLAEEPGTTLTESGIVKVDYAFVGRDVPPSGWSTVWETANSYGIGSTSLTPGSMSVSVEVTHSILIPENYDIYIRATDAAGNSTVVSYEVNVSSSGTEGAKDIITPDYSGYWLKRYALDSGEMTATYLVDDTKTLTPISSACDAAGNIYVLMSDEQTIYKLNAAGRVLSNFTGAYGTGAISSLAVMLDATNTAQTLIGMSGVNLRDGDVSWGSITSTASNHTLTASTASKTASGTTEYLKVTDFGFEIPASATITGITATVTKHATGTVRDLHVRLIVNDSLAGTGKADTSTSWAGTATAKTYGGTTDLWGLTTATLTPDSVQKTNFGIAISASGTSSWQAFIDNVAITVSYSLPEGVNKQAVVLGIANDQALPDTTKKSRVVKLNLNGRWQKDLYSASLTDIPVKTAQASDAKIYYAEHVSSPSKLMVYRMDTDGGSTATVVQDTAISAGTNVKSLTIVNDIIYAGLSVPEAEKPALFPEKKYPWKLYDTSGNVLPFTAHTNWQTDNANTPETIETTANDAGTGISVAVDASGNSHVAYYDSTALELKYGVKSGASWTVSTVASVSGVGTTAIKVNADGKPRILYFDGAGTLKYATYTTSWSTATVDSGLGTSTDCALYLTSADVPHAVYYDQTNGNLKYATYSSSWTASTIVDDAADIGRYPSITIDASANIHVAYYDVTNGNLKYVVCTSGTWGSPVTVGATANDVGKYTSIGICSSGEPWIACYNATTAGLWLAKRAASVWTVTHSVNTRDFGQYMNLLLGTLDVAYLVFYDNTLKDLVCMAIGPTTTEYLTLDSTGDVGKFASAALDSSGGLRIAYYDTTNTNPKYAYFGSTAKSGTTAGNVSAGGAVFLYRDKLRLLDGGNELSAVTSPKSYYGHTFASNSVISDSQNVYPDGGTEGSIAARNGKRYLTSITSTNALYCVAWDTATNTWGAMPVIDSTNTVKTAAVAIDSTGNPHVLYGCFLDAYSYVKYAKWNGASWDIETVATYDSEHYPSYPPYEGYICTLDHACIVLGATDKAHVSYCQGVSSTPRTAYYATNASESWVATAFAPCKSYAPVKLDTSGNPAVSYVIADGTPVYKHFNGATWDTTNLTGYGSASAGAFIGLVFDSSNNGHILWSCNSLSGLFYGIQSGGSAGTWVTYKIADGYHGSLSLALKADDYPVAVFDLSGQEIKEKTALGWLSSFDTGLTEHAGLNGQNLAVDASTGSIFIAGKYGDPAKLYCSVRPSWKASTCSTFLEAATNTERSTLYPATADTTSHLNGAAGLTNTDPGAALADTRGETTPPVLTIDSTPSGINKVTSTTITGHAVDNVLMVQVLYKEAFNSGTATEYTSLPLTFSLSNTRADFSITKAYTAVQEGRWDAWLIGVDSSNNETTPTQLTWYVDNTPPTILIGQGALTGNWTTPIAAADAVVKEYTDMTVSAKFADNVKLVTASDATFWTRTTLSTLLEFLDDNKTTTVTETLDETGTLYVFTNKTLVQEGSEYATVQFVFSESAYLAARTAAESVSNKCRLTMTLSTRDEAGNTKSTIWKRTLAVHGITVTTLNLYSTQVI